MLRIPVTALDNWDLYQTADWLTTKRYLAQLKGDERPGPEAEFGKRVHRIIERGDREAFGEISRIGRGVPIHRTHIQELKLERQYDSGEPITLVGMVDAIVGLTVVDYKTSSAISADKLQDSWQWRCYLMMLPRCRIFEYSVFLRGFDRRANDYYLADHATFTMHRYDGLEAEVLAKLTEYVRFLRELERDGHIKIGQTRYRGIGVLSTREGG